jgi:putative addiction module component (TIGR02574 family)
MSRTFEEVRNEAMALSPEERGLLAEELLDSVRSDEDVEWDEEYAAEIQRRVAEIEAGTAELVDADEAIAKARRALEDARQLNEVERRIALQVEGTIEDIEAKDLYRELRRR